MNTFNPNMILEDEQRMNEIAQAWPPPEANNLCEAGCGNLTHLVVKSRIATLQG